MSEKWHDIKPIKGTSTKDAAEFETGLSRQKEEGQILMEGEKSKTPEQLTLILLVNRLLTEFQHTNGIEDARIIKEEWFHFLDKKSFNNKYHEDWWAGCASVDKDSIAIQTINTDVSSLDENTQLIDDSMFPYEDLYTIEQEFEMGEADAEEEMGDLIEKKYPPELYDKDPGIEKIAFEEYESLMEPYIAENRLKRAKERFVVFCKYQQIATMIHEALHIIGFQRFYVDTDQYYLLRTGYNYDEERSESTSKEKFESFNEAVVEKINREICERNKNIFEDQKYPFDINTLYIRAHRDIQGEKATKNDGPYSKDIDLLDHIMDEVFKKTGQNKEETWKHIKEGYLSGNMMHLRIIDRVFGKGSLRLYSEMTPLYDYKHILENRAALEHFGIGAEWIQSAESENLVSY